MANKHLAPKITGKVSPSTPALIGHADMTPWERRYQELRPFGSYAIRPDWDEIERDFIAYWQLKMQKLLQELGHPSAKPIVEIDGWLSPVMRGDVDPSAAPDEHWQEFDKASFEATPPAERPKATVTSTRKHADGRVLNEKGETVGRWDDNKRGVREMAISKGQDPDAAAAALQAKQASESILDKVLRWAGESHHGPAHVERWKEAANGIKPGTFPGLATMTAAKASENATRFMKRRWEPVARAIRDREIGFASGAQSQEAKLEEALTVINERPDVEVRKYNPETNTLDVLSPATLVQTGYVAPEHKQSFIEYLERERDFLLVELGAGHPQNKGKILDHYIATVEADERMHSQEQYTYEEFQAWLAGAQDQRLADGTLLQADGTVIDLTKPLENPMFPFDGKYITDARTGHVIPFEKVAARRDELTADNVRYRLSVPPDRIPNLSWLALNYEGCLVRLTHNTETETRMVPAEEVAALIEAGTTKPVKEEHPFVNPTRIEIPFRFSYDSCVGEAWWYHEEALKKDREAYLKDPVWLRWLKAVDATDADVVPMERKEVNIKQEEWMGWHKHGAAMTSYLAEKRRWEESGGKTEQEVQIDWAKRTEEILAAAPKSTPAALEAAIKAGDWHKVAELSKAHAEAQTPPEGYVWFGRVRQGSVESGQYIAIGDGVYDEAILYLASSWAGEKPRLYQQNALNGPCRVRHTYDWSDTRHEGPYLRTWDEIRAQYDNI